MGGKHEVALIVLTGRGGELDRRRSEEAGVDAHPTKLAGLDDLTRLMTQTLGKRRRKRTARGQIRGRPRLRVQSSRSAA